MADSSRVNNICKAEIDMPTADAIFNQRPIAAAEAADSIAREIADQEAARLLVAALNEPERTTQPTPKAAATGPDDVIARALAGVMTAQSIIDTEYPPQQWAVPDLVPQGTSFIVGPPKLGKSIFVLGLAVAVASGGKALGAIDCEAGAVLYLALEDGPRRIQARLTAMTRGHISDRLMIANAWPRLDEGGLEAIDAWISSRPDARMVIVDTLKMLRPMRPGDSQSVYNTDYDAIAPLTRLASERVALMIVHHTRKAIADDPLASVSGSFGLTGAADGVLVLSRSRTRADATLSVIGRDLPERELALKFDGGLASWTAIGEAADVALSSARQAVIDYLKSDPHAIPPLTVSSAIGRNREAVRKLMNEMAKDGVIKNFGDGLYQLPDWMPVTDDATEGNRAKPKRTKEKKPPVTPVTPVTPHDGAAHDDRQAVTEVTGVTGVTGASNSNNSNNLSNHTLLPARSNRGNRLRGNV